jgi:hypothetical protein
MTNEKVINLREIKVYFVCNLVNNRYLDFSNSQNNLPLIEIKP